MWCSLRRLPTYWISLCKCKELVFLSHYNPFPFFCILLSTSKFKFSAFWVWTWFSIPCIFQTPFFAYVKFQLTLMLHTWFCIKVTMGNSIRSPVLRGEPEFIWNSTDYSDPEHNPPTLPHVNVPGNAELEFVLTRLQDQALNCRDRRRTHYTHANCLSLRMPCFHHKVFR